jgi:hypothetical protein
MSYQDNECMICLNSHTEVALPNCGHAFCKNCSVNTTTGKTWDKCPLCSEQTFSYSDVTHDLFDIIDPMGKDDVIEELNKNISKRINQAFDFLLTIKNLKS